MYNLLRIQQYPVNTTYNKDRKNRSLKGTGGKEEKGERESGKMGKNQFYY